MFYLLLFLSTSFLSYELIYIASSGGIPELEMISFSFVLAINIISFFTILLMNYFRFSQIIIFTEAILALLSSILIKFRKQIHFKLNLNQIYPYIVVIPLALLTTNHLYFIDSKYIACSNINAIIHSLSISTSISYAGNNKIPLTVNYFKDSTLKYYTYDTIYAAIMIINGFSPIFAFKTTVFINVLGTFSALIYLTKLFTPNIVATEISILIFLFGIRTNFITNIFMNMNNLYAFPLAIFSYSLIISGICYRYRRKGFFVLAAVVYSLTFTHSIDVFYGFLLAIYSLFIFTFPYQYFFSWQIVFQKIYIFSVILIIMLIPQMFFVSVVDERSMLLKIRGPSYYIGIIKTCWPLFIVFSCLSWISMKRSAQTVVFASMLFSFMLSSLISAPNPEGNLLSISSFYSGAVVVVSQFISHFIKSKKPYKVIIGMLVFIVIIYPGLISNAFNVRNMKTQVFTDDMIAAAKWAVKNTNPSDNFFNEVRTMDPFVVLAGRNTQVGPNMLLEFLKGDVPARKRILTYIYRSIYNPMVLKMYDISYVTVDTYTNSSIFKEVMKSELFTKVFSRGNITLYKVLKEKLP